jgi:hypothetical protein
MPATGRDRSAVPGRLRPRGPPAALAAAALALGACASLGVADAREAWFRRELGTWRYEKGCLDLWPAVLERLGARGYPLRGRDRAYASQGGSGGIPAFLGQGFETRRVEGGGLLLQTGWRASDGAESRYLVSGVPAGPAGCAVSFTLVWHAANDRSGDRKSVDWEIQLELLRQVDPAAAERVEAEAPRG